jgi:general L-amino acid transport system substrate-binding protein
LSCALAPVRALATAIALAFCPLAHAGPIIDRIKSAGVIRCGGVPRPGLVSQSADGRQASGLYLDLCRAIGAALLGQDGRIAFHLYNSDKAFSRVTDGADDLFFLDGSEIADHRLAGTATLGPAVYFVSTSAMVHGDAPIRQLSDLAGRSICFYQGDNAHMNLEASMAARRLDFAAWATWNMANCVTPTKPESATLESARAGIWRPADLKTAHRPRAAS